MANRRTNKKNKEIDNIVKVDFGMEKSPIPVQLTIHINNLLVGYKDSHYVTESFKSFLNNPDEMVGIDNNISRLIRNYGIGPVQEWFSLIYGWEFEERTG